MHIKEGIKNLSEKKLEKMKQSFNNALSEKAVQKLEEKKIDIAKSYFGKK
jgi:hypothetical protein